MVSLKRYMCGGSKTQAQDLYEDDDVYPVHTLDDTKTLRSLMIAWTICFNDALDAEQLRSSLTRLMEIGDWRKIGGRLRLKNNGALEIHVPRSFTSKRPAFTYSHDHFDMAIEKHKLAKNLPKADGTISIWPSPLDFKTFAARSDAPITINNLLSRDTPQVSLHITTFTNATLVAILWPHTLMDIMGQQAFLYAWSLVLAGRESEVPHVLGAREDVLHNIIDNPSKKATEYMLKSKQLKGFPFIKFGARFVWDMLRSPVPETRTICLPKKAMAYLRLQAEADLVASNTEEKQPFISDGDILTAWTMRAVATSLPRPRLMTALHAMNARFRLPSLINAPGVYLQNMLVPVYTFLSPELATGPLGLIALSNRQHLTEQATEVQVLASLREEQRKGGFSGRIYSDADALLMPFTNWTKAKLLHTADFRPAVVSAHDEETMRCNPPGTPTFHHAMSMHQSRATRLMVVILGKDYGDNYWLTLTMSPLTWTKIKESLQELDLQQE